MDLATIILFALAILMVVLAYFRGKDSLSAGLQGTWKAAVDLIPLFIAVFIIVGFSETLLPKEWISRVLGNESGLKGILIACGLGAITPGGPFVSYPIVAALYKAGAGIGPLVAYVTAWSLLAVSRLPLEFGVIGPRVTLIRLAASFIFPPLAGIIASTVFARFASG